MRENGWDTVKREITWAKEGGSDRQDAGERKGDTEESKGHRGKEIREKESERDI